MIHIGNSSEIPDIKFYKGKIFKDHRGIFEKPFYANLDNMGFDENLEIIVSKSNKNVIRGLHFQNPPKGINKLIYCIEGSIRDVFVDMRKSSPTFGKYHFKDLSSEDDVSILVPKGFAHGYSVLSENATVLYLQSGIFDVEAEDGISYKSLNIDWGIDNPVLSDKDLNLNLFDKNNSLWN